MSERERSCNRPVAARRALSPFAGPAARRFALAAPLEIRLLRGRVALCGRYRALLRTSSATPPRPLLSLIPTCRRHEEVIIDE